MIQDDRLKRKELYLEYLSDVPVHKWAAKYIMISENTSKNWRDEDPDFCDQCELRISHFVRRTAKRAKPEFQLERLMRNDFSEKKEIDNNINISIKDYGAESGCNTTTKTEGSSEDK